MKLNPPPGYTGPMDPHLSLFAPPETRGQPDRQFTCRDCGAVGDPDELMYAPGCTAVHSNCADCGYGPVCARDCAGIAKALADPGLVVRWHDQKPVTRLGLKLEGLGLRLGQKLKVRLPATPEAKRTRGVEGETLWVEVLELPDEQGRWSAKLLNKPMFIGAEWGDVVAMTTDFGHPSGWAYHVDVSPYAAVDLDEQRPVDGAHKPTLSVNETLTLLSRGPATLTRVDEPKADS